MVRPKPVENKRKHGLRARAIEPLEDRRLLALTVVTHDAASAFPAWVYDLGTAIVKHDGIYDTSDQNGNSVADLVENTRVDLSGNPTLVGNQQAFADLLLFDWVAQSETPGTADSNEVAGVLAGEIHERLAALDSGVLDLHFIGHGRGAMVNMEVIRRLANDSLADRIGFIQMTTLDPRSLGDDGAAEADPGGIVDFADNYYQDIAAANPVQGSALLGALNFHLNDQLSAWAGRSDSNPSLANHNEVHDWYHWTVDASVVSETSTQTPVDPNLPIPSAADRVSLYDDYVADLNADETPDDFGEGANIGYYFSIAGGGIGNLAHSFEGNLFTVDLQTGVTPLYLGYLGDSQFFGVDALAYAPDGDLYYAQEPFGLDTRFVKARIHFDASNQPVVDTTPISDGLMSGFWLTNVFRKDGAMFRAELNSIVQVNPSTGTTTPVVEFTDLSDWAITALTFDHNGDAYATLVSVLGPSNSKLIRIAGDFSSWSEIKDLPYDDVASLSVVGGLLYGFRESGAYFSYNITNTQTIERGPVNDHALLGGVVGTASLVTEATPVWYNRRLRWDVNDDGRVSTSDLLAVVNDLLRNGSHAIDPTALPGLYYDTNNDGRISTSDLLVVVNYLLAAKSTPSAVPAAQTLVTPQTAVYAVDASSPDWLSFAISLDPTDSDEDESFNI